MQVARLAFMLVFLAGFAQAAEPRISKVLPVYLDEQGRHSISPSLYERDAYQAELRRHRNRITGLRFDVRWKGRVVNPGNLRLRVEIRTANPAPDGAPLRIEAPVSDHGIRRHWTSVTLDGDSFRRAGEVIAWRAVLIEGDRVVAEQRSFLW